MLGLSFGRITVIEETLLRSKAGSIIYKCLCSCGNYKNIDGVYLRRGGTKSCGCLGEEYRCSTNKKGGLSHGATINKNNTGAYKSWLAMRRRCTDPKYKDYQHYHNKNIQVCSDWLNSFTNFLEDMGDRPTGLTLDRIDNDGNYCKDNCRWATRLQQSSNSTTPRLITFKGETRSVTAWAKLLNIPRARISARLNQLNCSVLKSLTTK